MGHGYLGDGYGKNGNRDPDGGNDDDRRGDWRSEQREHERGDRGRFMFEGRDNRGGRDFERDRGFFSRTSNEGGDWFRDDEQDYRSPQPPRGENRRFESREHEPYLRWRQQQMDALDRDYEDYCNERQQQFHEDFNSWRRSRQSGGGTGSQPSGEQLEELELTVDRELNGTGNTIEATDPTSEATLGTNTPENSHTNVRGS